MKQTDRIPPEQLSYEYVSTHSLTLIAPNKVISHSTTGPEPNCQPVTAITGASALHLCVCVSVCMCERGSVLSITAEILKSEMGMTELHHLTAATSLRVCHGICVRCPALRTLKASVGLSLGKMRVQQTNKMLFAEECVCLLHSCTSGILLASLLH